MSQPKRDPYDQEGLRVELPGFDVLPPNEEPAEPPAPPSSTPTTEPTPSTKPLLASIANRARKLRDSPKLTGEKRGKAATGLAEVVELVVKRAGITLHNRRTPDEIAVNTIWLATADEAKAIATPLGRILARTLPGVIAALFASGEGAVGDAVELGDATKAYIQTNMSLEADFHRAVSEWSTGAQPGQPAQARDL